MGHKDGKSGDVGLMIEPSRSLPRRVFLLAVALGAAVGSGCDNGGAKSVNPEIAGKKAKRFEELKAKAAANKGKADALPSRSPNGRPR
jgi:hypothetical protein